MAVLKRNELVKSVRKEMGLTQVKFSEKMKVDQSAVSYWESGECEFVDDRLFKLKFIFEQETGKIKKSTELFQPFIDVIIGV